MNKLLFDSEPIIYTTSAYLKPMKVIDCEGKEIWLWYVSEFVDDTFKNGEVYNPNEFGQTKEELLTDTTSEMLKS